MLADVPQIEIDPEAWLVNLLQQQADVRSAEHSTENPGRVLFDSPAGQRYSVRIVREGNRDDL